MSKLTWTISMRITLFLGLFLISGYVSGQSVANYSTGRSTNITYNSIMSTGNSFAGWRYTGNFSEDDNRSEATDIGFDFWYNGTRYTQFSVSTNGFLDFSSSTDDGGPVCDAYGYCNDYFSDRNGTLLALAPFYDDMTTGGGVDPLGTSIKYLLSGSTPNRVLTVEWDAMAVYQNITPDVNFQVKLHESTGIIEYIYETMDNGTNTFSYTVGINAQTMNNRPTASQLLNQRTANTTTFSNAPQNNLSVMPMANSSLDFTPPTPAGATGTLTFTAITNIGMTLNWNNWAGNEIGYVIYYSTDDVNYYFHTQTSADATAAVMSGLLPSTTYYWRVYAVTEGTLSTALTGSEITLSPGTITSAQNGRWNQRSTWDCNCIPTAADNVIIQGTDNVTIRNGDANCNDLTINGADGRLRFVNNNPRVLTVNGDLAINSGGRLVVANNSITTHSLNLRGDLTNNGILNLFKSPDSFCHANFTKTDGHQTISGAGTNNNFYTINIDKSIKSNVLEITSSVFSCDVNALNFISGGTFKYSSSGSNAFSLFSTTKDIPTTGKIWMNSATSTMNFESNINLKGDLVLDAGNVAIGNGADENLISFGGTLEINGGSMQIAGRYDRNNSESTSIYVQTAGTLTLPTIGSTSTTQAPFGMDVTGSSMTMSGGKIIIQRAGGSNLGYNTTGLTTANIIGGTVQIGDAGSPSGQIIEINSGALIGNILVNSTNVTAELNVNALNILDDITLTAGVLDANGLDITVRGDWLANGGSFSPSTSATVTLAGATQSITSNASPFNHLTLSGSNTKFFQDDLNINGNLLINSTLTLVNNGSTLTLGGNFTNNDVFSQVDGTVVFAGTGTQTITGTSKTDINDFIISTGSANVVAEVDLYGLLSVNATASVDLGTGGFTLKSTALDEDAAIGDLSAGGVVTGTLLVERYIMDLNLANPPVDDPLGYQYRYLSVPVVGANVAQLSISGIPVMGNYSDADIPSSAYGSIFTYDATNEYYIYYAGNGGTMASNALTNGVGYVVYSYDMPGDLAITFSGEVVTGQVDVDVIAGPLAGYNLIGNPYPSRIDWDNVALPAGVNDAIYLTDNANIAGAGPSMVTSKVNNLVTNEPFPGWNGELSMGQSFWVTASANATISFQENNKTTNKSIFLREEPPENYLRITMSNNGMHDESIVRFKSDGTDDFDPTYDAKKFGNYNFNLSQHYPDQELDLVISTLPVINCERLIDLRVTNSAPGAYNFSFSELESFQYDQEILLIDHFTGSSIAITTEAVYDFVISGDVDSYGDDRFDLIFTRAALDVSYELIDVSACDAEVIYILMADSEKHVSYWAVIDKDTVSMATSGTGEAISIQIDSFLLPGTYIVDVVATDGYCNSSKILDVAYLEISTLPEITSTSTATVCAGENAQLEASGSVSGGFYRWYLDSTAAPLLEETLGILPINDAIASTVYYVAVVNALGCEGPKVDVALHVNEIVAPVITRIDNQLIIPDSIMGDIQWFKDGIAIPEATTHIFKVVQPGEYEVMVKSGACEALSESYLINASTIITGIEDLNAIGLSIYPNPVKDVLNIETAEKKISAIQVFDLRGQLVYGSKNTVESQIDMSSFKKGLYILSIEFNTKSYNYKVEKL